MPPPFAPARRTIECAHVSADVEGKTMLKPSTARSLLGGLRILIGLGGLMAPRLGARAFGLSPERNPSLPYTLRLFAVRDAALGAGLLLADPRDRGRWLQLGMVSDASDAAASALAGRAGELDKRAASLCTVGALAAVALGAFAKGSE
jgi:hypothetical protein